MSQIAQEEMYTEKMSMTIWKQTPKRQGQRKKGQQKEVEKAKQDFKTRQFLIETYFQVLIWIYVLACTEGWKLGMEKPSFGILLFKDTYSSYSMSKIISSL